MNYVCEVGAKANSAYRQIPAAMKSGNFTLALNSYVFRLDTIPPLGMSSRRQCCQSRGISTFSPAESSSMASGVQHHKVYAPFRHRRAIQPIDKIGFSSGGP